MQLYQSYLKMVGMGMTRDMWIIGGSLTLKNRNIFHDTSAVWGKNCTSTEVFKINGREV